MESGFPKLVFGEHGDGSWERFIEEMNLCIESAVEKRGYVADEDGNRVPIMTGTARQALGESDREYLQRVESLSRYAEVANNNDRVRFALIVEVNGLRDREVSRDLMKNANLTWELLHEALRAREMANHSDRFMRADSRGTDLKSEVKREVAKVSEFDSRSQYGSDDRDRSYDSAGRSSPRGSPRSSRRYYGSEEHDTSRYGTRGREYNKDSGSRKYRDNSRERDKGEDVGYERRGSSRRSGGSRDSSYERHGSRDISRETYRAQESPCETRDKLSRYRDNSIDRLEGERYKERHETSRYDEGYRDNSKGRNVSFSGYKDKYGEDQ
ncbi:serine/threonine-protein kinase fray2-like [Watersipora subatra]|uniref:serine/threonine-protein kinase fray2-like n=1 Tax=Watersipora subatra TaxID=2589382 RepID=UPI00355C46A6